MDFLRLLAATSTVCITGNCTSDTPHDEQMMCRVHFVSLNNHGTAEMLPFERLTPTLPPGSALKGAGLIWGMKDPRGNGGGLNEDRMMVAFQTHLYFMPGV